MIDLCSSSKNPLSVQGLEILDWPKSLFGFFHKMLQKNPNDFFFFFFADSIPLELMDPPILTRLG